MPAYALFDTALGTCGIAWSERGVVALQLPEASPEATRERLLARHRGAEPGELAGWVAPVVEALRAHLEGRLQDLAAAPLDLSGLPPFHRAVCEAARRIPAGTTVTYGELAAMAGSPGGARAVGQAMARNPIPLLVPCHRVVAGGRRLGGFSASEGPRLKRRLLALEGCATEGSALFGARLRATGSDPEV